MASRVNTRFVAILILVFLVAGGGLGGLWYIQVKGDSERIARLGEEALAAGDLEQALSRFGRASRKEPENLEYLQRVEDVLSMMRPDTSVRARERFGQMLAVKRQRVQYHAMNPEFHDDLLDALLGVASMFGRSPQPWNDLELATTATISQFDSSEPVYAKALAYRIRSGLERIVEAEDREIDRIEEDIEELLEINPNADAAHAGRIMLARSIADKVRAERTTVESDQLYEELDEIIEQARQAVPNGFEVAVQVFRSAMAEADRDLESDLALFKTSPSEANGAMFERLLTHAVECLGDNPKRWDLQTAYTVVMRSGIRALCLDLSVKFDAFLENDPENLMMALLNAQLLGQGGEFDESVALSRAILDAEPIAVSIVSQHQSGIRAAAAKAIADNMFIKWELATDADERSAALAEYESMRDTMRDLVTDIENDRNMLEVEGVLAYMNRDFAEAARRFERMTSGIGLTLGDVNTKILILAAETQNRLGNVGRANEHLALALNNFPRNADLLAYKTELEISMGRLDDAQVTAATLAEVDPTNPALQLLAEGLERAEGEQVTLADKIDPFIKKYDMEGARGVLAPYLEDPTDSEHFDALTFAATIEFLDNQLDEAERFLERAETINADHPRVVSLRFVLEFENPVDRLLAICDSLEQTEDNLNAIKLSRLARLRNRININLAALEGMSGPDAAEKRDEFEVNLALAQAKIDEFLPIVRQATPRHPLLFAYEFDEAIADQDWTRCDELVQIAAEENFDECNGMLARSRVLKARGEMEAAVTELQAAVERLPFSPYAWNALGEALEEIGNDNAAIEAFREAYRYNPRNISIVSSLVVALTRQREFEEALQVIRAAHNLAPRNSQVSELRYRLEAEAGDLKVALVSRERIWTEVGVANRDNAVGLVQLYSSRTPDRSTILSGTPDEGMSREERYDVRSWNRMSGAAKNEAIANEKASWIEEAEDILAALKDSAEEDGDENLGRQVVRLEADLLAGQGRVQDAVEMLEARIQGKSLEERSLDDYLTIVNFLRANSRFGRAEQYLLEARAIQGDGHEVDRLLGEFYYARNEREKALQYMMAIGEAAQTREVEERIVDLLTNLGRFDEARQRLDQLSANGMTFVTWMLDASIFQAEGLQLLGEAKEAEAYFKFTQYEQSIEEARKADPKRIMPILHLVSHYSRLYRITGDSERLETALQYAAEAENIRPGDARTGRQRFEIFILQQRMEAAIAELSQLISRDPRNLDFRKLLMNIHLQQGNLASAEQATRDALEVDETDSELWQILGRILQADPRRRAEAVEAFRRNHEIVHSPGSLTGVVQAMLQAGAGGSELLSELRDTRDVGGVTNAELTAGSGSLMCLEARALMMNGNRADAIARLRDAYAQFVATSAPFGSGSDHSVWFNAAQFVYNYDIQAVETELRDLIDGEPSIRSLEFLAQLWASTGAPGIDRATELIGTAISRADSQPANVRGRLHELRGMILQIRPEGINDAIDAFKMSFDLDNSRAGAANNYAYLVSERRNDPAAGLPYAEKAVELAGNQPSYLDTLGWIQFRLDMVDEAHENLIKAVRLAPSSSNLTHLAAVLVAQGNFDSAARRLDQAEQLQPSDETGAEIRRLRDDIRTKRGG